MGSPLIRVVDTASLDAASSTARVARALAAAGIATEIVAFAAGTRTSADAAAAIGCELAQIAESIVFRATQSDRAVVVVTSCSLCVDEARVSACIGEEVGKAGADFVRDRTGFAIGGVAPGGLPAEAVLLVDLRLLALDPVWAAAGTPRTVFRLPSAALAGLPGAQLASVSQPPGG